jgi:hypothetical protein
MDNSQTTKEKWLIRIAGYGTFDFEGTEEEAEEMRKHKANWEKGSGIKWRVTNPTLYDKLTELQAWYWDNEGGCPGWVMTKKRQAKQAMEAPDGKAA